MIFKSNDIVGDFVVRLPLGKSFVDAIHVISPAKSITGFVGGIGLGIFSALYLPELIVWLASYMLNMSRTDDAEFAINHETIEFYESRCIIGLISSFAAIFGDLFESALKRSANVKDSGMLMPGHGGMLDRFDSTLFAVGLYIYLIGK